jgi:hypothetical protein
MREPLAAALLSCDEKLRSAERALDTVNVAVGSVREQLGKFAADLASVEREIEVNQSLATEISELQNGIDAWLGEVRTAMSTQLDGADLHRRRGVFLDNFRALLRSLGHSAVNDGNANQISVDDRYIPYLGSRRLRSLGSASDHPRLIVAYVLALAEAADLVDGPHPGIVMLDEPLQQNPDPEHRALLLSFLAGRAKELTRQTIVFTSLNVDETARLADAGVFVHALEGRHFLRAVVEDHELPSSAGPL